MSTRLQRAVSDLGDWVAHMEDEVSARGMDVETFKLYLEEARAALARIWMEVGGYE